MSGHQQVSCRAEDGLAPVPQARLAAHQIARRARHPGDGDVRRLALFPHGRQHLQRRAGDLDHRHPGARRHLCHRLGRHRSVDRLDHGLCRRHRRDARRAARPALVDGDPRRARRRPVRRLDQRARHHLWQHSRLRRDARHDGRRPRRRAPDHRRPGDLRPAGAAAVPRPGPALRRAGAGDRLRRRRADPALSSSPIPASAATRW